jgi:hypothetical protein
MEYFLGSVVTLATLFIFGKVFKKKIEPVGRTLRYSQSHIHSLLAPVLPTNKQLRKPLVSQATEYNKKNSIRILFVDGLAYWIAENKFFVAEIVDGLIDHESARVVDTMAMDKVQLDKMIFIVDQLTEGR